GGSIYIVSGYTNLIDILNALRNTKLKEINHIIWKYNFGVYTKNKFISSHYHILYYTKPKCKVKFNTNCRYGADEKIDGNRSSNYSDREDVWIINREYKPGKIKNKNELPSELLIKLIQYSSNENDLVCDLFLGSFSTAKIAIQLNRKATGFELSKSAFNYQINEMQKIKTGSLLDTLPKPSKYTPANQGKPWDKDEKKKLLEKYFKMTDEGMTKKSAIEQLSGEFGRGYWSLVKILDHRAVEIKTENEQLNFNDTL
ncbi:MAG: site-specific DNA-methyltransferase, partial [bacterium]